MEKPSINGWFGVTTILGKLHFTGYGTMDQNVSILQIVGSCFGWPRSLQSKIRVFDPWPWQFKPYSQVFSCLSCFNMTFFLCQQKNKSRTQTALFLTNSSTLYFPLGLFLPLWDKESPSPQIWIWSNVPKWYMKSLRSVSEILPVRPSRFPRFLSPGVYQLIKSIAGWWYTYPTPLKNDGLNVSWDVIPFPIWWENPWTSMKISIKPL